MLPDADGFTDDTLLAGRVRYRQRLDGFRTGIEPVLLAAAVPAEAGDSVLEAGTGAGAASLCLATRVAGVTIVSVERVPQLACLAAENARANGLVGMSPVAADILALPIEARFDHVMANPPWHDPHSTASGVAHRDLAKRARPGLLADWVAALAARLHAGGTITLVLPTAQTGAAFAALQAQQCGEGRLFPLWPRSGRESKLTIIRARRLRRGPTRILPGLALHGDLSRYTEEARAVLEMSHTEVLF